MGKRGLTREAITEAAVAQIEEGGMAAFSLRALASSMGIQVSSLYNHIRGQRDLMTAVGLRAVAMLTEAEARAIRGREPEEALFALADAYRRFAWEHTELYRLVMGVHALAIPELEAAAKGIAEPILQVLSGFGVEGDARIHGQRLLRSVMHGFFALENRGGFSGAPVDRETSYRLAIECVAAQLRKTGGNTAL